MTKKTQTAPAVDAVPTPGASATVVESIKGFDGNLSCRGFQFEIGQSYEVAGKIEACANGFHACPTDEHPLSVFEYYPPTSRFALVSQSGETHKTDNKLASAKITINAEISLGDLTKRAIEWVFARAKWKEGPTVTGANEAATASGYQGAATASGTRGAATASGTRGAATASGDQGAATASGDQGAATASGYQGAATASGTRGAATASGYDGTVRGAAGNALFAVERDDDLNIVSVACGIVGADGIEPDTWYRALAGKLVRA